MFSIETMPSSKQQAQLQKQQRAQQTREQTEGSGVAVVVDNDNDAFPLSHNATSSLTPPPPALRPPHLAAKLVMELVGTYFLVLVVALVNTKTDTMNHIDYPTNGPLAIGTVLAALIAMGGHVSGAQYNPAVSVAVCVSGGMRIVELAAYTGAQCVGGLLGALTSRYMTLGGTLQPQPMEPFTTGQAFLGEFVVTLLLALVVLNVAVSTSQSGNQFYPLAIGFTVGAGAASIGRISGAVLNPAVGTALLLANAAGGDHQDALRWFWLYWTAPVLGGFVASLIYRFVTNRNEFSRGRQQYSSMEDQHKMV